METIRSNPLSGPQPEASLTFECWECQKKFSTVWKCKNCLTAMYCSKECQTQDWHKSHKVKCIELQLDGVSNKKTWSPLFSELIQFNESFEKEIEYPFLKKRNSGEFIIGNLYNQKKSP